MRLRRFFLLAVPFATSLILLECVGSETAPTPVVDAGSDVVQPGDSGNDAADTGKPDAGPPCIIPDSGASGSLDLSFSNAVTTFTNGFDPTDITVDGLGQTYITGAATNCVAANSGLDFAVVRLTQGGAVDTAFNPANKPRCYSFDSTDKAYAVRVDPDGKLVLAGLAGKPGKFFAGVARIATDGGLDPTFAGGQVDALGPDAGVAGGTGFIVAFDVAFDATTKKIWIVGSDDNGGGAGPAKGYIARLNPTGTIDLGFAGGVLADLSVDGFWAASDDGAGGVFAAGQTHSSPRRMIVKHFDATGAPVVSFGDAGSTVIPTADASTGDRARSLLRLADGRLVVAGSSYGGASGGYGAEGPVAVARLLANGAPDPSFGGGRLTASPKLVFNDFYMTHMLGQLCDGTVLLGGRIDVVPLTNQDLGLAKLDLYGAPQTSFADGGIAQLALGANQSPVGAAQDPKSGKVVIIGRANAGEVIGARFNP